MMVGLCTVLPSKANIERHGNIDQRWGDARDLILIRDSMQMESIFDDENPCIHVLRTFLRGI